MELSLSGFLIPELGARTKSVLVHSVRPAGDQEKSEIERDGAGWVKCLPDAEGAQEWEAILGAFKHDSLVKTPA